MCRFDRVGCAPDLIQPGITGEIFTADAVDSLDAPGAARSVCSINPALPTAAAPSWHSIPPKHARGLAQAYAEVTAP